MNEKIIDGKKIADALLAELKESIAKLPDKKPTLAVVLVGHDPSSKIYVESKKKACAKIGITSIDLLFKETISQEKLIKEIKLLNQNPEINGILVQLPLPPQINANQIIEQIDPEKDVDGLHPYNLGQLVKEDTGFVPCTPLGIKTLLEKANIDITGKHVVIVGRSALVGKPLALLLLQDKKGANATVTIAHSKTNNLAQITKNADVLISAVGKPKLITKEMVKPGAIVIDVGISRKDGKIVGDVDFDGVLPIVSYITPVPKGVGPLTIALLMHNTFRAFQMQQKSKI